MNFMTNTQVYPISVLLVRASLTLVNHNTQITDKRQEILFTKSGNNSYDIAVCVKSLFMTGSLQCPSTIQHIFSGSEFNRQTSGVESSSKNKQKVFWDTLQVNGSMSHCKSKFKTIFSKNIGNEEAFIYNNPNIVLCCRSHKFHSQSSLIRFTTM